MANGSVSGKCVYGVQFQMNKLSISLSVTTGKWQWIGLQSATKHRENRQLALCGVDFNGWMVLCSERAYTQQGPQLMSALCLRWFHKKSSASDMLGCLQYRCEGNYLNGVNSDVIWWWLTEENIQKALLSLIANVTFNTYNKKRCFSFWIWFDIAWGNSREGGLHVNLYGQLINMTFC